LVVAVALAMMFAAVFAQAASAAPRKALINASTVSGSPSQEQAIAVAQGFDVTVVSDATWATMTAADFGQYDLLIAGDPFCGTLPPGLVSSAPTWGPVVLGTAGGRTLAGNRIVVGTDPVLHDGGDYTSPGARGTIIREGIGFAGAQPGRTGMYFDSTCGANYYGQSAETLAILSAMSAGSGAWTLDANPPCGGNVSLIASNPAFTDLTTASLQGWSCSVHEAFPTFPTDWSALAVATDTASKPTCGVDPGTGLSACGEAYILIAGSSIVVVSGSISVTPTDATNPVGTSHTITAHVTSNDAPLAGQLVTFTVTGQNAGATGVCAPADCKSDSNGDVKFTYTGTNGVGDDTIKASFTDAAGSLQSATAQKHWVAAEDPTISLSPGSASNPVGTNHTVTATVSDGKAGTTVTFRVTAGPNTGTTGTGVTDATGTATFTYAGTGGTGTDTIQAEFTAASGKLVKSNEVSKTWTPRADTTAPSCALTKTGTDSSGKKYIEVTVGDSGGLHAVEVLKSVNSNTVVPAFADGTTSPVVVRSTKIIQSKGSTLELRVTDLAGNVTDCDPTSVTLRLKGRRGTVRQRITGVPAAEHKVRIDNGHPGLSKMTVLVNGRKFVVKLRSGRTTTLSVASAMRSGRRNTITLIAKGNRRSSATVTIHD
jgi:hypothetical protein